MGDCVNLVSIAIRERRRRNRQHATKQLIMIKRWKNPVGQTIYSIPMEWVANPQGSPHRQGWVDRMQGIGFYAARLKSEGDRIMEYGDKSSFGEDPFRSTSDWCCLGLRIRSSICQI